MNITPVPGLGEEEAETYDAYLAGLHDHFIRDRLSIEAFFSSQSKVS